MAGPATAVAGVLALAALAMLSGCGGGTTLQGQPSGAGAHAKVALRNGTALEAQGFGARYDSATGQCAAGSRQFLSQDEIRRLKTQWDEMGSGCTGARKRDVPASADYPALLQARGVAGAAHVLVLTDRDGSVHGAHAVCATDTLFAEAAETTARAIAYAPASCAGKPVRNAFLLPFNYSL